MLTDHVDPGAFFELEAEDAEGAISELAELMAPVYGFGEELEEVIEVVRARERSGSTGLGGGVAIPHARFGFFETEILAIGRSREGMEFDAPDGLPVHLAFLLLGPRKPEGHLAMLAAISSVCRDELFLLNMLEAEPASEMYQVLGRFQQQ